MWLAAGLALGAGLGLFLGWVAWPIQFTNADPTVLEEGYQRDYTLMIAGAFALDGDLGRARQRLASLGKPDDEEWLVQVTVEHIVGRQEVTEIGHLVRLAAALGWQTPIMDPYLAAAAP
jgi:hypothetical protein